MKSVAGGVFVDVKKFVEGIEKAKKEYSKKCKAAAMEIGAMMEKEVRMTLSHPGTGRVYTRRGIEHQASAPGEPPAPDTGSLRASVTHEVVGSGNSIEVRVGTNKKYGKTLEFGTFSIAPRPWLFKTIKENWSKALDMWSTRLNRK